VLQNECTPPLMPKPLRLRERLKRAGERPRDRDDLEALEAAQEDERSRD
jgi:hypothetical protein